MMPTVWRLHLTALVITLVSEWIGVRDVRIGTGVVLFLPLLYAFALGSLASPATSRLGRRLFPEPDAAALTAKSMLVVAILPFIARFGTLIGPSLSELAAAGRRSCSKRWEI